MIRRLRRSALFAGVPLRSVATDASSQRARANPLAVLGLDTTATVADVRQAYLRLAKVHHPDCGGCPKQFSMIHDAYEVCRDLLACRTPSVNGYGAASEPADSQEARPHRDYRAKNPGAASGAGRRPGYGAQYTGARHGEPADGPQPRPPNSDGDTREFWEEFRRKQQEEIHMEFVRRFRQVEEPVEIDQLLEDSIASGCMADPGEALSLALRRYHFRMGYGIDHITKCFAVIERWEALVKRSASAHYYQELLTLYTNNDAAVRKCGAQSVVEVVTSIMDHMRAKGLEHDDLTYMLARFALSSLNTNP